ncbi:two pore domain potassium channel family protein [Vibrio parahaemolyticus]|nr:two pore domain potassium channel family protein [Vibrio parahaemolyticus]ELB2006875.1 two pore domain potassium channel family protein [Vibrio parahaemolyticus]
MIKVIDKHSYKFFVYLFLGGVAVYWVIFYILSLFGHGVESTMTPKESIGAIESLYFSVVTISSLGYGDFRPVGFGRFVAMTEVIYGLVIIALVVSKLASERTSTLVRLTYTSDVEKRIKDYIEGNSQKNFKLMKAIDAHNYDEIDELVNDFRISFSAYLHFLAYHSKEGEIEGRWAEKAFLKLLRNVSKSSELISGVMRLDNLKSSERLRCEKALKRAIKFGEALKERYEEQNIIGNADHISKVYNDATKHVQRVASGNAPAVILTNLTPELIERVRKELPKGTDWPRHVHKDIAEKLRISKNLAHKALSEIAEEK